MQTMTENRYRRVAHLLAFVESTLLAALYAFIAGLSIIAWTYIRIIFLNSLPNIGLLMFVAVTVSTFVGVYTYLYAVPIWDRAIEDWMVRASWNHNL